MSQSRNAEAYSVVDTIETPRSYWTRDFNHKTSFNAGVLIPFYCNMDIIPGTTIKSTTSIVCRMSTPIYPIMDNIVLDTYWFRVPKWWLWKHFRAQRGEFNGDGNWSTIVEYTTPQIKLTSNSTKYGPNDSATYMGIPQDVNNFTYDKLSMQALMTIWNYYFRVQALEAPLTLDDTDNDITADGTIQTGYGLLPVSKNQDYFVSAAPYPQRASSAVSMPLGITAPVKGNGMTLGLTDGTQTVGLTNNETTVKHFGGTSSGYGANIGTSISTINTTGTKTFGVTADATKSGLIADLSTATAATVNALRLAFATQRILEAEARFGTQYPQYLKGMFGVNANSIELQIPEYLGGKRIVINIETALQTSQATGAGQTRLGETGAYSVTADVNEDFTKSFTTEDILMGVLCVRTEQHTYQQGLSRQFKRERILDFYNPKLSHIGQVPIYNYEIYLTGTSTDNQVFGYHDPWQEYLYTPSRISGEMSSVAPNSLDAWHLGDDYTSLPVLSANWMHEPTTFIDRTLAVGSSVSNQFWADIYVKQDVSAPIPLNRTPGLLDHF